MLPADHAYHKRHMQWTQNGSLDRQMMVFIAQQIVFGYRYYANQYSKLLCMSSADPWSLLYKTQVWRFFDVVFDHRQTKKYHSLVPIRPSRSCIQHTLVETHRNQLKKIR